MPRRTIRVRLAVSFVVTCLASGAALLGVTAAVWEGTTAALSASPSGRLQTVTAGVNQHSSDWHQLLIASAAALAIMAGICLGLGWLVAGRVLRPLRRITATTREISATSLHRRLNVAGPDDELKELADTFDELLDRLERSFTFERRFAADAAHELRTPLAGMRTSLDVAMAKPGPLPRHIDTLAGRLRRELGRVDRLLEGLLTLAQAQHGQLVDQVPVSLSQLARDAVSARADAISLMRLRVEQRYGPDAWTSGSETLLARVVENLVDNAVGHNKASGWVRVTTGFDTRRAHLVVENGGPLLDAADVALLTEPFRRIGAERTGSGNGSGLGLAIVASTVDAHGGTLELDPLPGGGLRVAITLPLAWTPA
ncbi:MAG: sensor histidine kinase [Solirubrobacteraceae bacterium]